MHTKNQGVVSCNNKLTINHTHKTNQGKSMKHETIHQPLAQHNVFYCATKKQSYEQVNKRILLLQTAWKILSIEWGMLISEKAFNSKNVTYLLKLIIMNVIITSITINK